MDIGLYLRIQPGDPFLLRIGDLRLAFPQPLTQQLLNQPFIIVSNQIVVSTGIDDAKSQAQSRQVEMQMSKMGGGPHGTGFPWPTGGSAYAAALKEHTQGRKPLIVYFSDKSNLSRMLDGQVFSACKLKETLVKVAKARLEPQAEPEKALPIG
jgi:hypothetical protein